MTIRQLAELRKLARSGPGKVPGPTARVLLRDEYVERLDLAGQYKITVRGRGAIAREEFREYDAQVYAALRDYQKARRVYEWMSVHDQIGNSWAYVRHVINARLAKMPPGSRSDDSPGPDWEREVQGRVDRALDALEDFDAAMAKAEATDGEVVVSYSSTRRPLIRAERRKAIQDACREDGVVDLTALKVLREEST